MASQEGGRVAPGGGLEVEGDGDFRQEAAVEVKAVEEAGGVAGVRARVRGEGDDRVAGVEDVLAQPGGVAFPDLRVFAADAVGDAADFAAEGRERGFHGRGRGQMEAALAFKLGAAASRCDRAPLARREGLGSLARAGVAARVVVARPLGAPAVVGPLSVSPSLDGHCPGLYKHMQKAPRTYADLGPEIFESVVAPGVRAETADLALWRRRWRKAANALEALAIALGVLGATFAFAAGFFKVIPFAFVAGLLASVSTGLTAYSKYANHESSERTAALNRLLALVGISPEPDLVVDDAPPAGPGPLGFASPPAAPPLTPLGPATPPPVAVSYSTWEQSPEFRSALAAAPPVSTRAPIATAPSAPPSAAPPSVAPLSSLLPPAAPLPATSPPAAPLPATFPPAAPLAATPPAVSPPAATPLAAPPAASLSAAPPSAPPSAPPAAPPAAPSLAASPPASSPGAAAGDPSAGPSAPAGGV